jgi:hypothetical protein
MDFLSLVSVFSFTSVGARSSGFGDLSYEKSFLIFLLLIKLAAFGGQRLG